MIKVFIYVSDFLRDEGLKSFTFFDFMPVGLTIMFGGIAFMVFIGRHLLPQRDVVKEASRDKDIDWNTQYDLQERLFNVRIPGESVLVNKSLAKTRMGSALDWNVIGITRNKRTLLTPGPSSTLQAGDLLTVEGCIENLKELKNWQQLMVEEGGVDI